MQQLVTSSLSDLLVTVERHADKCKEVLPKRKEEGLGGYMRSWRADLV